VVVAPLPPDGAKDVLVDFQPLEVKLGISVVAFIVFIRGIGILAAATIE